MKPKKVTTSPIPQGKNIQGQFNLGFEAGVISSSLNGLKAKAEVLPEGKNKTTFMSHISQAYQALETWTRELAVGCTHQGVEA